MRPDAATESLPSKAQVEKGAPLQGLPSWLVGVTAAIPLPGAQWPLTVLSAISLLLLPVTLTYIPWRNWSVRLLCVGFGFAIVGFVVANLVTSTPLVGAAYEILILLAVLSTTFLLVTASAPRTLYLWCIVGSLVGGLLGVPSFDLADVWKFAIGVPVALALAYLADRLALGAAAVVMGSLAIFSLLAGFRSLALTALIVTAVVSIARLPGTGAVRRILLILGAIGAIFAANSLYSTAAESGFLGRAASVKYAYESSTEAGVLGASRPEFFVSYQLIGEKPILGWGTDPRASYQAQVQAVDTMESLDVAVNGRTKYSLTYNKVESHSMLLSAWTRGGILATAPFLALLGLFLYGAQSKSFLVSLSCIGSVWDILFSPYSHLALLTVPISASLALRHAIDGRYDATRE